MIWLECQSQINPLLPTPKGVLRDPISKSKMGEEYFSSPKIGRILGEVGRGCLRRAKLLKCIAPSRNEIEYGIIKYTATCYKHYTKITHYTPLGYNPFIEPF